MVLSEDNFAMSEFGEMNLFLFRYFDLVTKSCLRLCFNLFVESFQSKVRFFVNESIKETKFKPNITIQNTP